MYPDHGGEEESSLVTFAHVYVNNYVVFTVKQSVV